MKCSILTQLNLFYQNMFFLIVYYILMSRPIGMEIISRTWKTLSLTKIEKKFDK